MRKTMSRHKTKYQYITLSSNKNIIKLFYTLEKSQV